MKGVLEVERGGGCPVSLGKKTGRAPRSSSTGNVEGGPRRGRFRAAAGFPKAGRSGRTPRATTRIARKTPAIANRGSAGCADSAAGGVLRAGHQAANQTRIANNQQAVPPGWNLPPTVCVHDSAARMRARGARAQTLGGRGERRVQRAERLAFSSRGADRDSHPRQAAGGEGHGGPPRQSVGPHRFEGRGQQRESAERQPKPERRTGPRGIGKGGARGGGGGR